jgi:site-specific DNA recombinase
VKRRPREFDVLLIDDTSRLSRNRADQARMVEQLQFDEFRIVAVSQGIDTSNEQADVLMAVHGLVDSLYIKDLAKKTHRGLEGRVLNGQHAGGRCFGYRSEHGADGVRLTVKESEASVLRRIFEMSASGLSLKAIARTLNEEGVPSPRRSNGSGPATWCPTAIRAMLRNELYIGRLIWNRRKWIKRPGTNKRVPRVRPRAEWKTVHVPELRIVDADLWQRVMERQQLLASVYGHAGAGIHKASSSRYLLTGFLKCGLCGGNLIIVQGKGKNTRQKHYGCSQNFNRGACQNSLRVPREVVENNYFRRLQDEIVTAEVVDYTTREFLRRIREKESRQPDELAAQNSRKLEVEGELRNLTAAVAQAGHSKALLEALQSKERELDQITAKLSACAPKVELFPANIRDFILKRVLDLTALFKVNVARARSELAKHVREIRMRPVKQADGIEHYFAEGEWNLLGGLDFALVAGEGFEPSTFGL